MRASDLQAVFPWRTQRAPPLTLDTENEAEHSPVARASTALGKTAESTRAEPPATAKAPPARARRELGHKNAKRA